MSHPVAAAALNPELLGLFADSVLGLYLDDRAAEVWAMGRVLHLAPGAALSDAGAMRLFVVLDGRLAGPSGWYGPGNHVHSPEGGLQAVDVPARVWMLDLSAAEWRAPGNLALRRALVGAIARAEDAERAATPPAILPDPATLCDSDHPEIRRQAVRLRRATPASTAEAVLQFVQRMPYRFGPWQERASDTLRKGVGMCTTKTNLQVALMRACGLRAGFAEFPIATAFLGMFMPEGWRALQRPTVRHYYGAVMLGGRWHAADASFCDACFEITKDSHPEAQPYRRPTLAEGRPYVPALMVLQIDPWQMEVVDNLHAEMGKKSRFQPRHFEALNTRLDRTRARLQAEARDGAGRRAGEEARA